MRLSGVRIAYEVVFKPLGCLLGVFALAFLPAMPASADSLSCSSADTYMNIVAHQDDSIIFQNPDLIHGIQMGKCSISVFLTGGEAGKDMDYVIERELGAQAAYAHMAGLPNTWLSSETIIGGHTAQVRVLEGSNVTVIFLRIPDGGVSGTGFGTRGSLEELWKGTRATLTTIDGTSTYSRQELIDTLATFMNTYQPSRIDTQDFVNSFGEGDHSDHYVIGLFTQAASRLYATSHVTNAYRGYPEVVFPVNVSGTDLTWKISTFFAYAPFDPFACGLTYEECEGPYTDWIHRQYIVGSEEGGACSSDISALTVVSDGSDKIGAETYAVATYAPLAWTASIPGATWIWNAYMANPAGNEDVTFTKEITIDGTAVSGTITIAADDYYEASLNGITFATVTDLNNYSSGNEDVYDVSSLLHAGENVLSITVHNIPTGDNDPVLNPAGLAYKLTISKNSCETTYYTTDQPAYVGVVSGTNLTVVYDGLPKSVPFTTLPSGLPLNVTYNGISEPPTDAGVYAVFASVFHPNYSGSALVSLTIGQADQVIAFDALSDRTVGDADFAVVATSSSSLPVTWEAAGSCTLVGSAMIHLTQAGVCTVTASQGGDNNYKAAEPVSRTFTVMSGESEGGDNTEVPPVPQNNGGTNGPILGSFGFFGGGSVLGASTTNLPNLPAGCDALLTSYMRQGKRNNDPAQVRALQEFLNKHLGLNIPVTGFFGPATTAGVKQFQLTHAEQILAPWGLTESTGFVYKTTQRWINLAHCSSLTIPMPDLTPYAGE